jgi:hypothetical protein
MNKMQRHKENMLRRQGITTGVDKAASKDTTATAVVQSTGKTNLQQDLEQLKTIASIQDKIKHKRAVLLPKYLPVAHEYLGSEQGGPCEALVYCMIWAFDTGDIDTAFKLFADCVSTDQEMPERFKSTLPVFAFGAFYDWAEEQFSQGHSIEPYFADVYATVEAAEYSLPDALVANFHKLKGHIHFDANQLEDAITAYDKVVAILGENKSGVKTKLAQAQKKLEKEASTESSDQENKDE